MSISEIVSVVVFCKAGDISCIFKVPGKQSSDPIGHYLISFSVRIENTQGKKAIDKEVEARLCLTLKRGYMSCVEHLISPGHLRENSVYYYKRVESLWKE